MPSTTDTATLPARLNAVAHQLLDEEGPDALTMRRLAAAAQVAPMSIYNHFGSKDGIIDQLVRDGFEALRVALTRIDRTEVAAADLREGCLAYRALALARPHLYSVMLERAIPGYTPTPSCMEVAGTSFDVLVEQVAAGQRSGQLIDGDPVELAERLWATIHGLITLELHGYGFVEDREAHYLATVDTVLRGLRR
jgi:AcrR family transcriptional regulator